ncbi:MAG: metal ABC transporter ATP-binding protein [Gammaproteobacteria bacterium]|nr:metal ABC transporter ATP-binding protein [Gammaproteobacteria bacterium]
MNAAHESATTMATVAAAESNAPLLRLDGIRFRRNGRVILDNAALSVGGGEIVTLIGPNGAGKSTLVKIALNLLAADAGVVTRAPNLRIGYVPQLTAFDPTLPLNVRRFLDLADRGRGRGNADAAAAGRALTQAGAADLRDAPLQELSGGEMRRVLLARALLRDPDLLILDEPGAGMDINGQVELYRLFQAIRARRHCAILLVSHDLYMVMAATDRVFCLNRHLCCSGQPEDVRRHPQFLALFGARAAAELAVYQHHHDHEHGLHGDIRPAGATAGDAVSTAAESPAVDDGAGAGAGAGVAAADSRPAGAARIAPESPSPPNPHPARDHPPHG